jgi:non-specific serine/threonine protein kinase
VACALGVRELPGRTITATLSDNLCTKEVLLVLDNCEHLLEACAQLAETLLRSCPRLHILATSRQALGLAGEIAWLVPAWRYGAETRAATASEMLRALAETEAVQLFIDRAAGAQPGFRLTAANGCRGGAGVSAVGRPAAAYRAGRDVGKSLGRRGDRVPPQ